MEHTCDPSTWEAEVGGPPVQGQAQQYSDTISKEQMKMEYSDCPAFTSDIADLCTFFFCFLRWGLTKRYIAQTDLELAILLPQPPQCCLILLMAILELTGECTMTCPARSPLRTLRCFHFQEAVVRPPVMAGSQ
jgi:hypothetical protein